jgi:outer membrane protein assembly factor BamB
MKTRTLLPVLSAGLALLLAAADWPQWRGPDRSDVSRETDLLKTWPKEGPRLLWTFDDAGTGFSGPAIVGDRLYVMGAKGENEFLLTLDVNTGNKVWSSNIGAFLKVDHGSGPRGTPTVDGDSIIVLGGKGDLACFDRATGTKKWSVAMTGPKGLGGSSPHWGYSESPLVDGPRVVCTPGGSDGSLAAIDKSTGKVLWRSKSLKDAAGYSSVVVAELGGVKQYVQQTMNGIAGIAPEDGQLLWYYPRREYRVAVIPTVVIHDGLVYAVAGYGAGASLLKVDHLDGKFEVHNLYDAKVRSVMDNKHGGVVAVGDYIFGWSDSRRGKWVCEDLRKGSEVWSSSALGRGSLTCADGNLYCYSEDDGTCVLVPATPDGWKEKGRFTIPRHPSTRESSSMVWTHPVVANGRLYLRDQGFLFCYDVKHNLR